MNDTQKFVVLGDTVIRVSQIESVAPTTVSTPVGHVAAVEVRTISGAVHTSTDATYDGVVAALGLSVGVRP